MEILPRVFCCTKCQICFHNRYPAHTYTEMHVRTEIMHTAAAEWEWSIIQGEKKTTMEKEREGGGEREREREVGYELER